MATAQAKRDAQKAHRKRAKERGAVKVQVTMEPQDKARLDRLADQHGSVLKAILAMLDAAEAHR